MIKFHCRNKKLITFLVAFKFQLFDSGVCLPFSKENKVQIKKSKVKLQEIKLEREHITRPNYVFCELYADSAAKTLFLFFCFL